tara:strand:- start:30 stop:1388 length:1359 start_codon:yes stop_codon:yes gene_type:complete
MGFFVRLDQYGVSSMIRWLNLDSGKYTSLLLFFRASSWNLKEIQKKWGQIVLSKTPAITIDGRYLIAGDGIKIPKEAKKMPGVKRLHQDSDNSGKASCIYGHHFGALGVLAGWAKKKIFCIPLRAELHEGAEQLRDLQGKIAPVINGKSKVSVTTLMASMAVSLVEELNVKSIIVLDAYFSVGPVFDLLKEVTKENGKRLAHVVTRAKSNVVAYEDPPPKTGKRGAPRKYGMKLKICELFKQQAESFQKTAIEIYGENKTIGFLCLDLVWKPIKEKIRFVLINDSGDTYILMCSDLTLSPEDIITAYSYRFKIEVNFKVVKHVIGAFFSHFWTSAWPETGSANQSDLSSCKSSREKRLITDTMNAIEGFVNFGCIAAGILQILSLNFHESVWSRYTGWLRTISSTIPSEETVKFVVQKEFFYNFRSFRHTLIYRIIRASRKKANTIKPPLAA